MFRPLAIGAAAALLLTAAPAHAKTFRGKTNQGRPVSLITDAAGVPTRVRVAWRAPCKRPTFRVLDSTVGTPPFDAVSADALRDAGTYRVRFKDGGRGRITAATTAKRVGDHWTGTFSVRGVYGHKGKVTDVCQAK